MIYKKLLDTSKETGVPVKKIEDLFFVLKTKTGIDGLVVQTGIAKNVLSLIMARLSVYITSRGNEAVLSDAGLNYVNELLGPNYKQEEEISVSVDDVEKVVSVLKKYQRPTPKREYDQFTATLETTIRRVGLMNFFEDIRGKRILFLGDDDLMSVAVNLVGEPMLVQALDIDKRQLEVLQFAGKDLGKTIFADSYDARVDLPARYKKKFDVVFTDPPYTPDGVKLFLSRSIDALDQSNEAGRIYFCFGNSDRAKERFLPIYETIVECGLMIRWVFDKFNRYNGAESIGSTSSLFVCDITPKTKSIVRGVERGRIYTNN